MELYLLGFCTNASILTIFGNLFQKGDVSHKTAKGMDYNKEEEKRVAKNTQAKSSFMYSRWSKTIDRQKERKKNRPQGNFKQGVVVTVLLCRNVPERTPLKVSL